MISGFNTQMSTDNAILKLDISKTYDRISWAFILEILHRHRINSHLIRLIKMLSPIVDFLC